MCNISILLSDKGHIEYYFIATNNQIWFGCFSSSLASFEAANAFSLSPNLQCRYKKKYRQIFFSFTSNLLSISSYSCWSFSFIFLFTEQCIVYHKLWSLSDFINHLFFCFFIYCLDLVVSPLIYVRRQWYLFYCKFWIYLEDKN